MITILGLGPGHPEHLTREAWDLLSQTDEVYLRTARHPLVAELPNGAALHSFDHLYEASGAFDQVYELIAREVLALGKRPQGVLYAVPGHPLIGEASVTRILDRACREGLVVRLVEGLSFVEPVLSMLHLDGLEGLQLADATTLAAAHHPALDPDRPALVAQLYGQRLASEVKLTLMNAYPDDHPVTLVRGAGTEEGEQATVPLYELDRVPQVDHLTTLYVPPLPYVAGMPGFQETVAHLRAPEGCPWDQKQTHQSLRSNLLEEAYEVLEALDAEDAEMLCEELGDLLMQIAMHAQIAVEGGAFGLSDVIAGIDAKLKRRHPHVFGDLAVSGAEEVLVNWEAIKANEHASEEPRSRLAGVPTAMPSLARAQSIGRRVARAGFDWSDVDGVLDKVDEELEEMRQARDASQRTEEFGDLLFSLANVARWLDIDAEGALRGACDRFTQRYRAMEQQAQEQGVELSGLSLEEQDALWEQAKNRS